MRNILLSHTSKYLAIFGLILTLTVIACGGGSPSGIATPVVQTAEDSVDSGKPRVPAPSGKERLQLITLLIATSPDFTTLDPSMALSNPDVYVANAIYENLVSRDAEGKLQPVLAEKWEANSTKDQWTFTLRSDVVFHHGKKLVAEDVVTTFKRLLDPSTGSPVLVVLDIIEDVVAIDELTVRFDLKEPSSIMPDLTAIAHAKIIPSDKSPDDRNARASGTGPFVIESHSSGSRTVLKKFEKYWKEGQPRLSQLTFLSTPSMKPRIAGLQSGQLHVVFPIEIEQAKKLENTEPINVVEIPAHSYVSLSMDVTTEPFNNKLVRQAFRISIDRQALVDNVLKGHGSVGNDHPIAPSDSLYWSGQKMAEYNVDAAKALLAQAGFSDGIDVTLHTSTVMPAMAGIVAEIKKMAEPAGFRITVKESVERGYLADKWLKESFATATWRQRPANEAMALMYRSDSTWNTAKYSNSKLDELIKSSRVDLDKSEIEKIYKQIQEILIDEVPTIIPVFMPMFVAMRDSVESLEINPYGGVIANNAVLLK